MSGVPNSDLLVAQSTPPEEWVLALRPEEVEEEKKGTSPERETAAASSDVTMPALSLEERISVEQLRVIMNAFSNSTESNPASPSLQAGRRTSSVQSPFSKYHDSNSLANLSSPASPSRSAAASPRKAMENLLRKHRQANEEKHYDRELTTDEFLEVMVNTVSTASREEILELINKVDYEGKGRISWDDLSTFLTAQSRRREYMSSVKLQFLESPEPPTCAMHYLHQQITCYTIEKSKSVILTGGSEGTVRAWGLNNFAQRGLIFQADSWVVGLHFSNKGRALLVCTMNRTVYVLDGNSFEVHKVFKGRAATDNSSRVDYALSSTRNIRVGGVAFQRRADQRNAKQSAASHFHMDHMQKAVATSSDAVITPDIALQSLSRTDNTPLTEQGTGPYVQRMVEEGVMVGLIDSVICTLYYYSKLGEDNLLLATGAGSVYIFKFDLTSMNSVYTPSKTLALHHSLINKMELFVPLNALITSSDNGVVLVTSMVTGKTLHTVNVNTATTLESRHSTVRSFAVHARLKMMVTIGAERYGLVWDMATERVVAQLDPHNAPLKCCGISDKLEEIITCSGDGVIQLYDCNGFQLVQRIELGRLHAVSLLSISSVSQSLFCFGRYPFQIRSKRQASSNCPANYTGHFGAMLGSLYSKTFDQIITVDTDALAMTWVATTGKPIFSFVFNDFSDSATMNSARVTSISMDGLQRRILTGYNNGAMVVWNAVNGQPINFMTAAIPGAQRLLYPKDPEEEEKEKALQKAKPWRQGNTKERSGSVLHVSDGDDPANEEPDDDGEDQYGNVSEVTATGSLVRRGVTFFLFSTHKTLYNVRESTDFTTATATRWTIPTVFGAVTAMEQVGEHIMALGMASGALLFYHVLSERQDGQPLFVKDFSSQTSLLGDFNVTGGSVSGGTQKAPATNASFYNSFRGTFSGSRARMSISAAVNNTPPQYAHITANVLKIVPLPKIDENLFLSVYVDGTVAFWQTFRRLFLGSVSLLSGVTAFSERDTEVTSTITVDVDTNNRFLVFSDEVGDIHVCEMELEGLSTEEEKDLLRLKNPATYTPSKVETRKLDVSFGEDDGTETEGESEKTAQEPNRKVYALETFKRTRVFGTGLGPLVSLLLVGSEEEPMVVCTATSRYTRVFNLKGEVMGELGMNTWNDKDPSTFRFMNETRAPGAPPPVIASSFARAGVTDVEFDYLEDALITQHIAMATGKKPRKSRQRSLTGSVVLNASGTLQGNEAGETQRFGGSISKPNPDHVMLGEALKTLNSIGANVSPVPQEDATAAASASQKSTNKDGTAPALTTVLRQSTRQRYLEEPTYRGIVKKGYANRIRQQTAVELANIIPTSPDDEDMLLPNVFPGEASSFFDAAQYSELLDKGYVPTVSNTLAPSAATAKHNPQYNQSLTSPDVSHDSPFDHSLAAPPRVQSSQPRRDSLTLRNRGADPPLGTASLSPNTGPFYPTDRTPDLPAVLPSASSDPTPRGVSRSWDRPSVAKGLTGSRQQGVRSNRNVMLVKNGGEEVSEEALVQQHMAQFRSQLTKSLKNSEQQLPPETVRTKKEEMQTLVNSVLQKDGKGGRTPVNLLGGAGKGRDNHSYLERVMVAPIDAGLSAGATAPATVERPTAKHTTKHGTKTKAI